IRSGGDTVRLSWNEIGASNPSSVGGGNRTWIALAFTKQYRVASRRSRRIVRGWHRPAFYISRGPPPSGDARVVHRLGSEIALRSLSSSASLQTGTADHLDTLPALLRFD